MKKVSKINKSEFDSKPVYIENNLKTEIKSCNEKINTNFYNNKIPKEGSQCTALLVMLIDSVYK